MKKTTRIILLFGAVILALIGVTDIKASTENKVVYFYSDTCSGCAALQDDGIIDLIESEGITLIKISTDNTYVDILPENAVYTGDDDLTVSQLWSAFNVVYGAGENQATPHMFVGDQEWNESQIRSHVADRSFFTTAEKGLLEVDVDAGLRYDDLKTVGGFVSVMLAGLLDGFNPCAIALLLLFISLLGFTENKKILTIVSITYISVMFVSYFLIGIGVLSALRNVVANSSIGVIVQIIILIIVLVFLVLNVYDYMVARNEEYGKIKSQIPKWLQRFNTRIMKTFTNAMEDSDNKGNIVRIILLTLLLGFIMTLTEFTCSGTIYLATIEAITIVQETYAYVLLLVFNIMFVFPMIVIAFIAIKSRSTMTISNWMRENMHVIKLFNAIIFLILAVFLVLRLTGVIH